MKSILHKLLTAPGTEQSVDAVDEAKITASGNAYPILRGVPIMIDDGKSLFRQTDFLDPSKVTTMKLENSNSDSVPKKRRFITLPPMTACIGHMTAEDAIKHVTANFNDSNILVIGAGDRAYPVAPDDTTIYTDVAIGRITDVVADAHDLPFKCASFDLCICVAVLEHVLDPQRVVREIRRVLKPNGYVYADTPFMQQVHLGKYDFTRFTALGHRMLFKEFASIQQGVSVGPASAFLWSGVYLSGCLASSTKMYWRMRALARFLLYPVLALDGHLSKSRGAQDCAGGYYFFGRLDGQLRDPRSLLAEYRGFLSE